MTDTCADATWHWFVAGLSGSPPGQEQSVCITPQAQ